MQPCPLSIQGRGVGTHVQYTVLRSHADIRYRDVTPIGVWEYNAFPNPRDTPDLPTACYQATI